MSPKDKREKNFPFPPFNVSVNYYTDPIYSTDAFYGYVDESGPSEQSSENKERKREERLVEDSLDEPVESWGWINNVD